MIVHVGLNNFTVVGSNCLIVHCATLHGIVIGYGCLIGIGATVMDGAVIDKGTIVAGHAVVRFGLIFEANSVIAGIPARKIANRDSSEKNNLSAYFSCEKLKPMISVLIDLFKILGIKLLCFFQVFIFIFQLLDASIRASGLISGNR